MEIPEDVARAERVPDDLDSSTLGPYTVPSLTRRRRAGLYYLGGACLAALSIFGGLPIGMWIIVAALAVIGGYHFVSAWNLRIQDKGALEIANRETDFAVGHASATLGFTGWRARPIWNVLVFSADDPPTQRGLVRVDGVNGDVKAVYVEANPSD